jgi:hypothetical protein
MDVIILGMNISTVSHCMRDCCLLYVLSHLQEQNLAYRDFPVNDSLQHKQNLFNTVDPLCLLYPAFDIIALHRCEQNL